jgi:seryl-tRNA synthetase
MTGDRTTLANPTTTHRVELSPPVPESKADHLATRVFFISEAILDFTLVRADGHVHAVDVVLAGDVDTTELTRKFAFVVATDVLARRQIDQQVLWRAETEQPPRDVYDELLATGAATEAGDGQITLGEPVLSLMDSFDSHLLRLCQAEFGAREYRYPTLIPTSAMARSGYFRSFPHMMMFVARMHGDLNTYREFLTNFGEADIAAQLRSSSGDFDHCLPPAVCFHTYHQLADRKVGEQPQVVTARGKSFRYEARYRRSLERLWDFTIREIVFLGSRADVLDCRERLMRLARDYLATLGLGGRCEVANDPFFVDPGTANRVWSQQVLRLKYEFRLPLEPGRDLAACSFNFHEQFFGEAYGIADTTGTPVHTACAGFGLERMAYAFLCQHGVDPAAWPPDVVTALST